MKKRLTLKKNYEFRRLYRKGTSAAGGCMVVYCLRNRLGRCRLGLTASTKLGNAVKRNRARRRLREVFRLNLDALKPGYDVILVARSRTLSASWKEMNTTFLRLCRKLGLARDTDKERPAPPPERTAGRTPPDNGAEKPIPSGGAEKSALSGGGEKPVPAGENGEVLPDAPPVPLAPEETGGLS